MLRILLLRDGLCHPKGHCNIHAFGLDLHIYSGPTIYVYMYVLYTTIDIIVSIIIIQCST